MVYCICLVHMQHETTQCFLKQSRDFCILVCERSEVHNIPWTYCVCTLHPLSLSLSLSLSSSLPLSLSLSLSLSPSLSPPSLSLLYPNKKIIVGASVEVPECPQKPNCTRGKVREM